MRINEIHLTTTKGEEVVLSRYIGEIHVHINPHGNCEMLGVSTELRDVQTVVFTLSHKVLPDMFFGDGDQEKLTAAIALLMGD